MDKKVIDLTEWIKKHNRTKTIKSYETCLSESYAEDLANEFKSILKEETKIKKSERRE